MQTTCSKHVTKHPDSAQVQQERTGKVQNRVPIGPVAGSLLYTGTEQAVTTLAAASVGTVDWYGTV